MAPSPLLQLNSGHAIPQLAFGTLEVKANVVKEAFDAGYRHFDCAMFYGNEKEVGQDIAESMKKHCLKREDIFVTSKLWCDKHDPKDVRKTCEESLRNLGLDYLDLYLIHWPVSFHLKEGAKYNLTDPNNLVYEDHKLEDTWREMEKLVSAGLVKSVGVSNFNKRQIEHIIKHGKIVPAVNQVEVNLHCLNTKLIDFCHSKNIVIEGYAPLGSPGYLGVKPILQLEIVTEIAKRHIVTPAQVLIRHALQRNIVVIAKSSTAERMRKNLDVMDFELSEEEMYHLNNAGQNKRLFAVPAFANHPEYPFHDEF
ncbi:hypothetical protein Aperf_G00000116632 [Anoplocephala perfoliata]